MVYLVRNGLLVNAGGALETDIPVYTMKQCAARIQNPNDTNCGGNPKKPELSRIGPQTFTHTVQQVDATIRDYTNTHGNNIALWLDGDYALRYAGIDRSYANEEPMNPQERLNEDAAILTIILPTSKVTRVHPSDECRQEMRNSRTIHAYGLDGEVLSGDIFGILVEEVKSVIPDEDSKKKYGFLPLHTQKPNEEPKLEYVINLLTLTGNKLDQAVAAGLRFK